MSLLVGTHPNSVPTLLDFSYSSHSHSNLSLNHSNEYFLVHICGTTDYRCIGAFIGCAVDESSFAFLRRLSTGSFDRLAIVH